MTETASLISVNHPFKKKAGSIGAVMPGQEVRLSDEGEILVRGSNVSPGYWNQLRDSETGRRGDAETRRFLHFSPSPCLPSPRLRVSPSPRLPVSPSPRLPVSASLLDGDRPPLPLPESNHAEHTARRVTS